MTPTDLFQVLIIIAWLVIAGLVLKDIVDDVKKDEWP